MSSPNEYQIPHQPSFEADVSLHASSLQSVEAATKLNDAQSDVREIYSRQEVPAATERSLLLIGRASVAIGFVRKEALKDAA